METKMARYECIIRFIDEEVGEFMYQVNGMGLLPSVIESVQWGCKNNIVIEKPFRISTANLLRDRAIYFLLQNVGKGLLKTKFKDALSFNTSMLNEYLQPSRIPLKFDVNSISR
jgi:hypothetical protein